MQNYPDGIIVLSKTTKIAAPFLHAYAWHLYREMPEIFFNPVIDEFLVRLHNAYQDNAAWYEEEMCDNGAGIETVARIIIMVRDDDFNSWMYPLLQEAVQAPYEDNIGDLIAELPLIWKNRRARLFLCVVAEMLDTILYFRQDNGRAHRCSDLSPGKDGKKREKITA